jgi:hypothetical protein
MHAISVAHRREKHVGYHIFYFFDPLRIREAFPGKTGFHPFRKNSVKLGGYNNIYCVGTKKTRLLPDMRSVNELHL